MSKWEKITDDELAKRRLEITELGRNIQNEVSTSKTYQISGHRLAGLVDLLVPVGSAGKSGIPVGNRTMAILKAFRCLRHVVSKPAKQDAVAADTPTTKVTDGEHTGVSPAEVKVAEGVYPADSVTLNYMAAGISEIMTHPNPGHPWCRQRLEGLLKQISKLGERDALSSKLNSINVVLGASTITEEGYAYPRATVLGAFEDAAACEAAKHKHKAALQFLGVVVTAQTVTVKHK